MLVSQKRTNTASASLEIVDVPLDPFQVARDAIKPARERGLQSIGAVGRQMRRERGFHDQRLGNAFARGIVSELAGRDRAAAGTCAWSA